MCSKPDCLLKKDFRSLGWEICRRTGYTFSDIYIYWCESIQEHVVYLRGDFAGYVEGFWHQGHIYRHYNGEEPTRKRYHKQKKVKRK